MMCRLSHQHRFTQHFTVLWVVLRVALVMPCADNKNLLPGATSKAEFRVRRICRGPGSTCA
jgi:hypothetical protein